jgi:hypothetical protein
MADQIVLSPNLAGKASVRNWFKKSLAKQIIQVRAEKNQIIRPQWLRYYNLWALRGTEQSYHGRLRMYLPVGHRIIENWVQKLRADLFPDSGKWFKNTPDSTTNQERGVVVHELMMRLLRDQIKITGIAPGFLRNLCIFGTSIVEMGWKLDERDVPSLISQPNPMTPGKNDIVEGLKKVTRYIGPTMRTVDPFLFYVYPYTPQYVQDCELIFEDMMIGWGTLERMADTPIDPDRKDLGNQVENWQEVKRLRGGVGPGVGSAVNSDKFQTEQIRLLTRGLTSKAEKFIDDPKRPIDFTKIAWFGTLDASGNNEDREGYPGPDEPQWWQFWMVGDDVLVQARQLPWWKQQPPWLAAKFCEMQNEFWGYGVMFLLDHFQYFMNDTMNQTGDGLVFSLNPVVAMDANAIQFPDSIRMAPAARWLIRDPRNSINFIEPPKDSAMAGINVINFLIAMMNDVSNVAPFGAAGLQAGGRSRGRAVETATGMSIVSGEALLQVRDVVENIEQGVLNEALAWMFSLLQQCLDRDLALRVAGADGATVLETQVTRDTLIDGYSFEWLGSTFSFNQNVRTAQLLQFIQVLARVPPQFLAQDNARVDWKYLLREIWSTGFGDREAELIIKDITPTRQVDPEIEDQLFEVGRGDEVTVSPTDDDMHHAQVHNTYLQSDGRSLEPYIQQQIIQHIQRHAASFAMKQQAQQEQAMQQAMQQAQAAQGTPGQSGQPGPPGQPGQPGQPAQPGTGGTPSRNVMPEPPGRAPSTTTDGDVQRRLPRTNLQ